MSNRISNVSIDPISYFEDTPKRLSMCRVCGKFDTVGMYRVIIPTQQKGKWCHIDCAHGLKMWRGTQMSKSSSARCRDHILSCVVKAGQGEFGNLLYLNIHGFHIKKYSPTHRLAVATVKSAHTSTKMVVRLLALGYIPTVTIGDKTYKVHSKEEYKRLTDTRY